MIAQRASKKFKIFMSAKWYKTAIFDYLYVSRESWTIFFAKLANICHKPIISQICTIFDLWAKKSLFSESKERKLFWWFEVKVTLLSTYNHWIKKKSSIPMFIFTYICEPEINRCNIQLKNKVYYKNTVNYLLHHYNHGNEITANLNIG